MSDVRDALTEAGVRLREWSLEEDWDGGGLAIYYMGHGDCEPFALCLRDGDLLAADLAAWVAALVPDARQPLDLDLVLDSTFASGVVGEFALANDWDRVVLDDVVAASLHDDSAWECDSVAHGLMTWSYKLKGHRGRAFFSLQECRTKEEAEEVRTYLRESEGDPVKSLSGGEQNLLTVYKGGLVEVAGASFEVPESGFTIEAWCKMTKLALGSGGMRLRAGKHAIRMLSIHGRNDRISSFRFVRG